MPFPAHSHNVNAKTKESKTNPKRLPMEGLGDSTLTPLRPLICIRNVADPFYRGSKKALLGYICDNVLAVSLVCPLAPS